MKKLLPIILGIIGLVGGIGAGAFLKPAPEPVEEVASCIDGEENCATPDMPPPQASVAVVDPDVVWDYVKLPKQFIVPIIQKDKVRALVVLSISLEVTVGTSDLVLARSPKLRDAFLQVLFDHANSGGFDGAFTTGRAMSDLRGELLDSARKQLGATVESILIEEMVKQTM